MFNPQPEPPAVLFELNASETEGASMDFFDDAGKVMGVEPSPFNEGFSIKMIDPGDDENLLEISANHLTDETKIRFVHPPEKDVITINSLPSTGASIKMFNPQSEPQTLLMDIAASYAGVKAGTAVISLYDDNNDLESHLEPGKISLEASTEGPPIILEVDPFELEARIGIGNSDPTANLVVGNNLGSFGGTRIIIGGTDPGTESGVVIGEDNDNRAWILWNVDNNTLGMGTKQNGAAFGSTIVLDSGRVGIGTASPGEELHVVGDICYTGSIGACSDARYKKDISTLSGALDRVASLRGVTFHWRCEDFPQNKFSDDEQVGLIAQEVNEVFPQIVTQTDKGYYNIDYARLTPLLVEAIKELRAENEDLKQRIENLEQLVE
jgi:hypothetical protein